MGIKLLTSANRALKLSGIDAVIIATPTSTHYQLAIKAIKTGKHIFVEKPIADHARKAKHIVHQAEKMGVKIMVGFIERFNPVARKLREFISRNVYGGILSLHAKRIGRPVREDEIGVIRDLAVHDIDLFRYLTSLEPSYVFARSSYSGKAYENHSEIMLLFDNRITGYIETNWLTLRKERRLSVIFERAVIEADYLNKKLTVKLPDKELLLDLAGEEPLKSELAYFAQCVLKNEEISPSGIDGLRALEIAETAIRSSRLKRLLKIKYSV